MIPRYADDDEVAAPDVSADDQELIEEIRDRYEYARTYWEPIRRERNIDLRFVTGDPWDPEERQARENPKARRPCISHDELSQYLHQSINNIRQNKRGIKVEPAGEGSDEKSAEYRQNRIRAIEYRSKAQSIYETAYQHMIEGSYGYWRIGRKYVSNDPDNWDQDIVIKPIANPDSVLYDPDCKEPDWSDARWCFVVEPMPKDEFKRKYPKARATDFVASDDIRLTRDWITDQTVLVAEYWKVEIDSETQSRRGAKGKEKRRTVFCKHVVQYVTNGVEILEQNDQPGEEIPIPSCIGLERFVNSGDGSQRKIFSLVRLARDPQMSLAYLVSLEAEAAGMVPKTPYVGYVGQFETDKAAWQTLTKIPYPFVQIDPIPDSANGQILPIPRREPFTVDFGSFEVAKESARRAIMAAMGISPLPTAAMRSNEKSGVAIQRIQQEQAMGSYHFVDNFERALERSGRIIESWLPSIDDTERDVPLCAADDARRIVRINTREPYVNPDTNQQEHYIVEEGEHDVTISVGPSNQSQRDAADDFLEALVGNLQALVGSGVVAPQVAAKLLSMAIEMKQLGPKGEQMAELISPDMQQQLPPQAQALLQQAGTQVQQLHAYAQQLEQKLQQMQMEKDAKIVDNQARMAIEQFKAQSEQTLQEMKLEAQITTAEIQTKSQQLSERIQFVEDLWKQLHAQGHEHAMKTAEMAHERVMADQEHENAMAQAAAQPQPESQQAEA